MSREIKFRQWNPDTKRMSKITNFNLWQGTIIPRFEGYVIMQYTGLKDKNGKEIYEGDIIRVSDGSEYDYNKEVKWDCGYIAAAGFNINLSFSERSEVIGNIYENPELLKKGTQ